MAVMDADADEVLPAAPLYTTQWQCQHQSSPETVVLREQSLFLCSVDATRSIVPE